MTATPYAVQLDGRTATAGELAPLAFAGYAHFTAMQVRGGRVRGLDLHLERLRAASVKLFGRALPAEQVRSALRTALEAGPDDASLSAFVYEPAGEFTAPADESGGQEQETGQESGLGSGRGPGLKVLVRTGPPAYGPEGPLALTAVPYERVLPEVKHVGEVAKTYFLRQAVAEGFDDAAFLDRDGRFSEATIWNLAFWDGTSVVWPEAAMLGGTTMAIVRRQLERLGVPQDVREITPGDLPGLSGAVVLNSWTPGVPVRRIASVPLPEAPSFVELLHRAYEAEPLTRP